MFVQFISFFSQSICINIFKQFFVKLSHYLNPHCLSSSLVSSMSCISKSFACTCFWYRLSFCPLIKMSSKPKNKKKRKKFASTCNLLLQGCFFIPPPKIKKKKQRKKEKREGNKTWQPSWTSTFGSWSPNIVIVTKSLMGPNRRPILLWCKTNYKRSFEDSETSLDITNNLNSNKIFDQVKVECGQN